MKNSIAKTDDYNNLRQELEEILARGTTAAALALSEIRLTTYWQVGRRLAKESAAVDEGPRLRLFSKLNQDLGISAQVLYQALRFYRAYPRGLPKQPDARKLSWGAHLELLGLGEPEQRGFYLERAIDEGMSRARLRAAIKNDLYGQRHGQKGQLIEALGRPRGGLHLYKAIVERVVDGDTLLVRVDLGFDTWRVERVRLRGIDTAPLATRRGQRAKEFVEEKLAPAGFVVLRTYKTDRYKRYVADVFYDASKKRKELVFEKGLFLNQQLLTAKLAVRMM
jgi:endonuclease YncB( thermonuclease family)